MFDVEIELQCAVIGEWKRARQECDSRDPGDTAAAIRCCEQAIARQRCTAACHNNYHSVATAGTAERIYPVL